MRKKKLLQESKKTRPCIEGADLDLGEPGRLMIFVTSLVSRNRAALDDLHGC
jgi:hypothetical protein